jgi:Na+/proline symporter
MVIIQIIQTNGYWSLIQRYSATPTEREAKKALMVSACSWIIIMPIISLPALIARQAIPDVINELVAGGLSPMVAGERSYILLCMKVLPAGIMGLIVIAIFAATMSALSSEYNIISAVATKDIYQGLIKKDEKIEDKKLLWAGRMTTLIVALLCTLVGSQVDKLGGAWHYMMQVLALTAAPTYLPPLVGLYYRRTPAWGANLAFFLGLATGIIINFPLGMPIIYVVVGNVLVTGGTCIISGLVDPVKGERKNIVDALFQRLIKPRAVEQKKEESAISKEVLAKAPNINGVIGAGCTIFALFLMVSALVTRADGGFLLNFLCAVGLGTIGTVLLFKPSNK